MRLVPFALLIASLLASSQAFATCLVAEQANTIVRGTLSEGSFEDANGNPEQAFILTPAIPTCLSGDENIKETEQVATIHIYSSNDAVTATIKQLIGKDVFVQGAPFGAHTAHHHAPIVMDVTGIQKY